MKKKRKSDFDYFLKAPILIDDPQLALQYKDAVIEERRDRIKNGIKKTSDTETMLYLSSLSLKNPLNEDATNVFMYLITKKMPDVVPEEIRKDSLNNDEKRLLSSLQSELFDKIVRLQKKIERKKEVDL